MLSFQLFDLSLQRFAPRILMERNHVRLCQLKFVEAAIGRPYADRERLHGVDCSCPLEAGLKQWQSGTLQDEMSE